MNPLEYTPQDHILQYTYTKLLSILDPIIQILITQFDVHPVLAQMGSVWFTLPITLGIARTFWHAALKLYSLQ